MNPPLLSVAGLSAAAADGARRPVLRNVSFDVQRGEVMGLVGESGAGKSTIAKAILGIVPRGIAITGGSIRFEGVSLFDLPRARFRALLGDGLALIPQDPQTALNPSRRAGAQLTDGLRLKRGLSAAAAEARGLALLEEVQVSDPRRVFDAWPHELSGGQRQRVLIAAAFSLEPKLIIADEPTTALDVTVQKQILKLIRRLQREHGTSLIFVSHDLGVVAQICDRVCLLYGGKIVEAGPPAQVFGAPRHPYTAALLAAGPWHGRPGEALAPVPAEVLAALRAELAADA